MFCRNAWKVQKFGCRREIEYWLFQVTNAVRKVIVHSRCLVRDNLGPFFFPIQIHLTSICMYVQISYKNVSMNILSLERICLNLKKNTHTITHNFFLNSRMIENSYCISSYVRRNQIPYQNSKIWLYFLNTVKFG